VRIKCTVDRSYRGAPNCQIAVKKDEDILGVRDDGQHQGGGGWGKELTKTLQRNKGVQAHRRGEAESEGLS